MAIHMNKSDQFKKNYVQDFQNQLKYYQNVENRSNFSYADFLFLKIRCFLAIIATIGFSRPQTPDFQKKKITSEKIDQFLTFW